MNNFELIARLQNVNMSLRQYITVFCVLLLVTLGHSYSMKYVVDRLNALETKLESESKLRRELETKLENEGKLRRELETKLESESKLRRELETKLEIESKLRRSETEEIFRMISELASGKILSRSEQVSHEENITPSEQSATKSTSADKYATTKLAIKLNKLKSYIINGVAVEKQQNVKLRSELKSISKQLEAENAMFESRIKEEIRNFTNDVSDKLALLVSEERFNNLSDFVTTSQSQLRNEARQSLFSLKTDIESSIQKLSNDFRTVNQTAVENVERFNNVSDSLTIVKNNLHLVKTVESCKNVPKSGSYMMHNKKLWTPLRVYCDQETDGGGWLVIQRRKDGSVDFYRNWADYKTGFGDMENEFWFGNDNIHALTSSGLNELRIDMMDFEGNKAYAKYSNFKVHPESDPESDLYKLEVGGYSGNATDSLTWDNGQAFSTKDRDNDNWHGVSCSEGRRGAWWYRACSWSNLNGHYYHDAYSHYDSIYWYDWKGDYYSLKTVEMKIR